MFVDNQNLYPDLDLCSWIFSPAFQDKIGIQVAMMTDVAKVRIGSIVLQVLSQRSGLCVVFLFWVCSVALPPRRGTAENPILMEL